MKKHAFVKVRVTKTNGLDQIVQRHPVVDTPLRNAHPVLLSELGEEWRNQPEMVDYIHFISEQLLVKSGYPFTPSNYVLLQEDKVGSRRTKYMRMD